MAIRMMTRQALLGAVTLTLVAGVTAAPAAAAPGDGPRSTFIVVLHDRVDAHAAGRDMARRYGGELGFVYEHALRGFSIRVSDAAAGGMARDRRVTSVERDQVVTTTAQDVPTGVERVYADDNTKIGIGTGAKVDVDIAIIDTGIADHLDLNVVAATNCSGGSPMKGTCTDGSAPDGSGHGTHVAGSAAALDNGIGVVGVAPGARLHAVKVLSDNGSGYMSWIVAGIDWVTARHETIEVANMSLGCECSSDAMNKAISASVGKGVAYVVAAGNSDKDSSTFSPANHPDVITVSALADFDGAPGGLGTKKCRVDQDDTLADFSNYGKGVEIAAPGVCILSTWPGGGYDTISGTSMASPHVAGAAAILASTRNTANKADTVAIKDLLVSYGNDKWTDDSGDGVKEPLLDVGNATVFNAATITPSGTTEPVNTAPTADFTATCTDLACKFDGSGSADSDGDITDYLWDFGDGATSTATIWDHTYTAAGKYTVSLTVTDDDGAIGVKTQELTVGQTTSSISLTLEAGSKVKGSTPVTATWTDDAGYHYDVFANGATLASNFDGKKLTTNWKGSGTVTYQVCRTGTRTCSEKVSLVI